MYKVLEDEVHYQVILQDYFISHEKRFVASKLNQLGFNGRSQWLNHPVQKHIIYKSNWIMDENLCETTMTT